ncbi:MAG: serine O-acetyltransferase EpsC [Victivallaceae bacterium]
MEHNCKNGGTRLCADFLDDLVKKIGATYEDNRGINHIDGLNLPRRQEIIEVINKLLEVVFPGFDHDQNCCVRTISYAVGALLSEIHLQLSDQISRALRCQNAKNSVKPCEISQRSAEAVSKLLSAIPEIRENMKVDVKAAFDGDPAAFSTDEIILSYPGIKTITIQRFAHLLYSQNVPLLPRMMTEYAHSLTGIDIHPGATLGRGLFIDHGTGVVIGETAVIGDQVKIYQGVTLGALSFPKDACGMIIKGARRHPTIGDNVTLYAGATVLGDIVIGSNSVIGGNVWITESIPPGTKVTVATPDHKIKYSSGEKNV